PNDRRTRRRDWSPRTSPTIQPQPGYNGAMCGRFTLKTQPKDLARRFGLDPDDLPPLLPRFNIAPSQEVAVVRTSAEGGRELVMFRWGLVPSWADDPGLGSKMINARAETVAVKPAYRSAFKHRRCLILADG